MARTCGLSACDRERRTIIAQTTPPGNRLDRLNAFLERDPHNASLLLEAASAAYAAERIDDAADLLDRAERLGPLAPDQRNLRGLVMLRQGRFGGAEALFLDLIRLGDAPQLRFNIAWARAMQDRFEDALAMLDDEVMAVSRRAPMLRVQMLHHLRRYDEGLSTGCTLAQRFPDDAALAAALATLAMDAGDMDMARTYAARAPGDADGLAVLGMLRLDAGDTAAAAAQFDVALALQPRSPRATTGKGLALLVAGSAAEAAPLLEQGAEAFADHLGSWVAAGWAWYMAGDPARSRACFERAIAVDPNFGEAHGGLAVLDLAAGDAEGARRRAEIAQRLDPASLGGGLARIMLMERQGDITGAERMRERALRTPIAPDGTTLMDALGRLGRRRSH